MTWVSFSFGICHRLSCWKDEEVILSKTSFKRNNCFQTGQIHVDNKLKDIQSHMDSGESVRGGLLTCLFLSQELTLEEIYANMTEMLLAGVDTVSVLAFVSSQ